MSRATKKFYSCTNNRDGGDPSSMYGDYIIDSPIYLREIDFLPSGTFVYLSERYPKQEGTPFPVSLDPKAFSSDIKLIKYQAEAEIAYIIVPPNWDREYKCWECQPQQVMCYDSDVNGFPQPCAWWQFPFLWICSLQGFRKIEPVQ